MLGHMSTLTDGFRVQEFPAVMNLRQVVDVTTLSLSTVERLVASGDLRSVKIGRRRVILGEDLAAHLRATRA